MSVTEIKEEAIRQFAVKIEAIKDEASLKIVLDFLDGIGKDDKSNINLSQHYMHIKEKYSATLAKLAK